MEIKVKSLYLKSSPRKIRPVLHSLRGQKAQSAMTEINFQNKKGARLVSAVLKSALAIGKENDIELDTLLIK
jgi:large subunit ribosomal protein L22